ncbi:putative 2OG-Fe(II) oxygenase [Pseudoxanthomonas mexicana]|uniref:putative 2OG-Fe(II) oxygenase n=1 Tax=Pseudoxanthomonas mexicana TaxID=128785 RepID=UPI00398B3FB5
MSTIITAFAVPIVTAQLDDCATLNAELRELFLKCESQGDKYANPDPYTHRNHAMFESAFTLFDWPHPAVAKMRDFCLSQLYQHIGQLNGFDNATLQRLHIAYESWFHITRRGGYFGVHNHPMHSWSGVYCVCQEGDEHDPDSGRLTFISPYLANTMYVDMASHGMKPPFQLGNIPTRLKPGQLVLFPSWLLHEVSTFEPKDAGLRITVAFNTRFRMDGVPPPKPPTSL